MSSFSIFPQVRSTERTSPSFSCPIVHLPIEHPPDDRLGGVPVVTGNHQIPLAVVRRHLGQPSRRCPPFAILPLRSVLGASELHLRRQRDAQ
jgi:hypothetical protein